jgi:transcription initiation factor TFIIIB Brf1 subunit/transcription initiation factor TFIIB
MFRREVMSMAEHQKVFCDKSGSSDFEYDSSWKEYSCKNCGQIVEDDEKISVMNYPQQTAGYQT